MASGVKVSDAVKDIYNEMKVVKNDADQKERIRLVEFQIDGAFIVISKIYREKDLQGKDVFQVLLDLLQPKLCTYMLYDCHFGTEESAIKQELVFLMWAPETAPIKEKMRVASSKDALKKVLVGIKHEHQINELADIRDRSAFAEKLGKDVTQVEGVPVRGNH